jgi:hypothetical protein
MHKLAEIGENTVASAIDSVVTLDIGTRGVIRKLYRASAEKVENESVTLEAAQRLKETVADGDRVLIMTGFIVPPWNIQETDGPSGAASLARAIDIAMGGRPFLLIEKDSEKILSSTCRAIGLNVMQPSRLKNEGLKHSAAIMDFTLDANAAPTAANLLLDELNPSAVISVEKSGRNCVGEYHNMKGFNVSAHHAKVEAIVSEARKRKILTIGVGDGGNEVGMGNIAQMVAESVPYAAQCQCPCGRGIAAESEVDLLVTAAISNWGAYGIAANLTRITGKPALHTPEMEASMLTSMAHEGAIDGIVGFPCLSVDGVPFEIHLAIIEILWKMAL